MRRSSARAVASAIVVACAVGLWAPVVSARTASEASGSCTDFVRFGERWEHCVLPDGTREAHRLGVVSTAARP
jgi:hypothetical protein